MKRLLSPLNDFVFRLIFADKRHSDIPAASGVIINVKVQLVSYVGLRKNNRIFVFFRKFYLT